MENRRIAVTRSFDDYLVNYTDNYFYATRYNDKDELKGVSFLYQNQSIMLIDNDSRIKKDNKIYNYGFVIGNNELKMGLFSFDGKEIKDSIYVNYGDNISIFNKDKKAIIEKGKVKFFLNDKEIKTIKHNVKVEYPRFIKKIEDMKAINTDEYETKVFDKITYDKILESDNMALYMNTEVTDKKSNLSVGKDVRIRLMFVSGDDKMLVTFSNFELPTIEFEDFTYIIKKFEVSFFEFDLNGIVLDLSYSDYLDAYFKYKVGRIRLYDACSMSIIDDKNANRYGFEDILGSNNHVVNMADVTSNIKLKDNKEFDAEEELNKLVGLDAAKKQIRRFKNSCIKSMENGFPINLHMMFLGNPGTGKTTFARLVADIFYKNGILPTNNYVEGSRDTLVGQYVGETEEKTNAIFQRAMGGVLFIDEAYSLYRPATPNDFGNVAMAELIKLMEDYRGKICVIFAGYTKEMHDLLRINSGLKSRIQYEIQFDDYTKDELRQILDINLKNDNYLISDNDANLIIDFVDKKRNSLSFANAREIRTAFEQITMIQAERTFKTDIKDRLILKCDVLKYIEENTFKRKDNKAPTYNMISKDYLKECSQIKYDLDKDYERIIESCIEINVDDYEGSSNSSGFIISPDGYAITAAHSVDGATKISARRRILDRLYNTVETYHNCYICGVNKKSDVAIIKIENDLDNKFPYLPLYDGDDYLPIFTEIIVFGYPLGTIMYDNLSGFKGYISSVQVGQNNINLYNLDVIAMPGSSGACIIDRNTMKVIGIVNGLRASNGHGIPFGCPIQEVWKLVNGGDNNE